MTTPEAVKADRDLSRPDPAVPDPAGQRRLDGELRIVREAILLVAAGGAPRVVLAGLLTAGTILDQAQRLALASGVRVVPLWPADDGDRVDLRVEAIVP